jgi:hypothetical protein
LSGRIDLDVDFEHEISLFSEKPHEFQSFCSFKFHLTFSSVSSLALLEQSNNFRVASFGFSSSLVPHGL